LHCARDCPPPKCFYVTLLAAFLAIAASSVYGFFPRDRYNEQRDRLGY